MDKMAKKQNQYPVIPDIYTYLLPIQSKILLKYLFCRMFVIKDALAYYKCFPDK